MTEVTITVLPAAPLYVFEIWSAPEAVAKRFEAAAGFALPEMGYSARNKTLQLIRYEPTVWLVEGSPDGLPAVLGDDGAITAIGGGVVRIRLEGAGWRTLLMEGGVFDAENLQFGAGCSASTIIDHVNVRLHVVNEAACDAYVTLSFSTAILHFWREAAAILA